MNRAWPAIASVTYIGCACLPLEGCGQYDDHGLLHAARRRDRRRCRRGCRRRELHGRRGNWGRCDDDQRDDDWCDDDRRDHEQRRFHRSRLDGRHRRGGRRHRDEYRGGRRRGNGWPSRGWGRWNRVGGATGDCPATAGQARVGAVAPEVRPGEERRARRPAREEAPVRLPTQASRRCASICIRPPRRRARPPWHARKPGRSPSAASCRTSAVAAWASVPPTRRRFSGTKWPCKPSKTTRVSMPVPMPDVPPTRA